MIIHIDATLIVQVILFGIFFYLLKRLFYEPVDAIFRRRDAEIEAGLRAAEESRRRAEEAQREVQRQLEEARAEAQRLIAAAAQDAEKHRRTLLERARQEADVLVQRARDEIARERQAAIDDLRRASGSIAILVASKVVGKPLDTPANRELADQTVAEVGRTQ